VAVGRLGLGRGPRDPLLSRPSAVSPPPQYQVLLRVDEYNAVRLKLTAEMADSSQLVKALVIKAEARGTAGAPGPSRRP